MQAFDFKARNLRNPDAHRAMALQLFSSGHYTLQQAARFADMPLESFISLLGECGIDAVDYPADESDRAIWRMRLPPLIIADALKMALGDDRLRDVV